MPVGHAWIHVLFVAKFPLLPNHMKSAKHCLKEYLILLSVMDIKNLGSPIPMIPSRIKRCSEHFPTLLENLTPIAAAHGLESLSLPENISLTWLNSAQLVESALLTVLTPLDRSPDAHTCISTDTEWNICRIEGVSILQIILHSSPDNIYIIPVRLIYF